MPVQICCHPIGGWEELSHLRFDCKFGLCQWALWPRPLPIENDCVWTGGGIGTEASLECALCVGGAGVVQSAGQEWSGPETSRAATIQVWRSFGQRALHSSVLRCLAAGASAPGRQSRNGAAAGSSWEMRGRRNNELLRALRIDGLFYRGLPKSRQTDATLQDLRQCTEMTISDGNETVWRGAGRRLQLSRGGSLYGG